MTIEKNKPTKFVRFFAILGFGATFLCFEVVAGAKAVSGPSDRGRGALPVANSVDAEADDFLAGGVSSIRSTTIADFADENVSLRRLIVPPSSSLRLPQPTSESVTTLRLTGPGTTRIDGSLYAAGTVHIISSAPVVVGPDALVQVGGLSISAPRVEIEGRVLTTSGDVQIHGVEEVVVSGTIQTASKRFASIEIEGAAVAITGSLVAPGGDRVSLLGRVITLESALIDVSGKTDGGTVTIGGKLLDGDFVSPARRVVIDPETVIRADAGKSGNGGTVIVWSDDHTYFAGSISCRGGSDRGDGGFVEVSAKHRLAYVGQADVTAANGDPGELLIDPMDIVVDAVGPDDLLVLDGIVFFDEPNTFSAATISATTIETLPAAVTLQATNSITINESIDFLGGNDLTLEAAGDITLNAAVTGATNLVITADAGFAGFPSDGNGVISVIPSLSTTGTIELDAGTEAIVFSPSITGTGLSLGSPVSFDLAADQSLDAGAGSLTATGSLSKTTAGSLTLTAGSSITLGGNVTVSSGGLSLQGDVTLDGGAQSLSVSSGTLIVGGSLTKTTAGDLLLDGGSSVQLDGSVSVNAGSLTISSGATVSGGIVTSTGNQLYVGDLTLTGDTTLSAPKVTIESDLDLGTLLPTVTNIVNDLELGTSSVKVIFELGGTDAADHDRIIVGGNVTLDGTLEIRLINGFVPQACDSFEIITANSVVGIFIDVIPPAGFKVNCPPPGDCKIVEILPGSFPTVPWYEDFDDYDPGSGLHGGLGWKGWDDDPAFDAPVTDVQANSGTNSVAIAGDANIVHDVCNTGSGAYTFSAWQYIPSDFVSGGGGALDGSYFILLNTYDPNGPDHLSVQLQFDSNDGLLKAWQGDGNNTINVPYDTDRWVKIQTVVDLNNDWTKIYYDDELITEYTWTGGILGDGGGALDIAVVDLYANGSSIVYYDDLTIEYCVINDDFDLYANGSSLQDQGGWKGWDNDPAFSAPVTQDEARSGSQSVAVAGASNLVHDYCTWEDGLYSFSAWQYIPSDFTSGGGGQPDGSYFVLLNTYNDGGPYHWSTQLQFNSNDGLLHAWHGDGDNTINVPYDTDRWVKIQTVVDLGNDWTQIYYDDDLVTEYTWTGGILGEGGGVLDIAAVDLFANDSSFVYYDDTSLLRCELEDDFEPFGFEDDLHGLGGWKGWDDDPAFSAPITQDQAHSGVQSLDVSGSANLLHEFCTRREDVYTLSAWQYIPSDFVSGGAGDTAGSYFVVYNRYNDFGPVNESVRIQVDSTIASVRISSGEMNSIDVPYDTDRWVKIQTVVDLDNDWTRVYYDDELITEYTWTGGIIGEGGGALDIAAVDQFANGSTSIYYDDIKIERGCKLEDDFDFYLDGSQLHGQGGWKGRDNNPAATAPVTQDQARSAPQAADIFGDADLVQEFCTPEDGVYLFEAWQYIPVDFASGGRVAADGSYFILLNTYTDGVSFDPSVQLQADPNDGLLKVFHGDGSNTIDVPYETDRWVKIQTVIDLDDDWTQIYYDD
ncbi:MAG: hypothetical protein IH987_13115, partial [Planctomycetes bacterium]|nr:hypothetical protein [Planctomycetota bacterium]